MVGSNGSFITYNDLIAEELNAGHLNRILPELKFKGKIYPSLLVFF